MPKKLSKTETVEVKFQEAWRGHAEGVATQLTPERATELHAEGVCKITDAGKKACEKAEVSVPDFGAKKPKKAAAK